MNALTSGFIWRGFFFAFAPFNFTSHSGESKTSGDPMSASRLMTLTRRPSSNPCHRSNNPKDFMAAAVQSPVSDSRSPCVRFNSRPFGPGQPPFSSASYKVVNLTSLRLRNRSRITARCSGHKGRAWRPVPHRKSAICFSIRNACIIGWAIGARGNIGSSEQFPTIAAGDLRGRCWTMASEK